MASKVLLAAAVPLRQRLVFRQRTDAVRRTALSSIADSSRISPGFMILSPRWMLPSVGEMFFIITGVIILL
ncbi:hypothetical protein KCP76_12430 [Salmonella enterica subsp. enterica serovar Weltevreden]|nr:hypothetical protein KCP76_12430 [Salmonella enterica subsp. enterica serovar Weltevreden]